MKSFYNHVLSRVIVAHENECESLREERLAADVERVIVARENESESLLEARLATNGNRVSAARESWSIFKGDISNMSWKNIVHQNAVPMSPASWHINIMATFFTFL